MSTSSLAPSTLDSSSPEAMAGLRPLVENSRVLALVLDIPFATPALLESLLLFSPRLSARSDLHAATERTLVFLDIACNAAWIQREFENGEVGLLEEVHRTLKSLQVSGVRMAIADTAPAAQALASAHFYWISQPGASAKDLERLPLCCLGQLEGVTAWRQPTRLTGMSDFFSLLGFQTLGELNVFTAAAFHERWGEAGDFVFKRLKAIESLAPQPIPPYVATEPLLAFVQLDFPVSLASLLLHEIDNQLRALFLRLEGRRLIARKLKIVLRCEYSEHEHRLDVEPSQPSRDARFFIALLERRLEHLPLENPIKDIEISIDPTPEKEQQGDFLHQHHEDDTRLGLLTSLLQQEGIRSGFAAIQDEVWPEKTWLLSDRAHADLCQTTLQVQTDFAIEGENSESGFSPLPRYGGSLRSAPRPTLLLAQPKPLSAKENEQLHFLSSRPTERIEHEWWEGRAGPSRTREYSIARDSNGRYLWIFREPGQNTLFLHGAFD